MERRGHIDPKVERGEFKGSYEGDLDAGREFLKTGKLPPLAPRPRGMSSASQQAQTVDGQPGANSQNPFANHPDPAMRQMGEHFAQQQRGHGAPGMYGGVDPTLAMMQMHNQQLAYYAHLNSMNGGRGGGAGAGGGEAVAGGKKKETMADESPEEFAKKLVEAMQKSKEEIKPAESQDHKAAAAAFGQKSKENTARIVAEKAGGDPEKVRKWMNPLRRMVAAFVMGAPAAAVAATAGKLGILGATNVFGAKAMAATIPVLGFPLAWPVILAGLGAGLVGGIIWHKTGHRRIFGDKGMNWEQGMELGWQAKRLHKTVEADDSSAAIDRKYAKVRGRWPFFRMQTIPRILGGIVGGVPAWDATNWLTGNGPAPLAPGSRSQQLVDLLKAGWGKGYETMSDPTALWESIRTKLVDMLGGASPDTARIEELRNLLEQQRWGAVLEQTTSLGNLLDGWNTGEQSAFLNAPGNEALHNEFVALHDEIARLENAGLTLEQYQEELRKLQERVLEWIRDANADLRADTAVEAEAAGFEAGEHAAEIRALTERVGQLQTFMDGWGREYEELMKRTGLFDAFQRLYGEVDYADAGDFRSPAEYAEYIRGLEERFGNLQESVVALEEAEDVEHERGPDRPEGVDPLAAELERLKDTFHYEGSHPRGVWGAIEDMIKAKLEARGVTDTRLLNVLTDIFEDYLQDGSMPGTRASSYFDNAILEQVAGREGATERNIFSRGLARFEYLIGNSDVLAEAMERIEMPVNRLSVAQRAVAEGIVQELYGEARRLMAVGRAG